MKADDWLVEVLHDIQEYAILNEYTWLVPLMNEAYVAAQRELRPTVSISEGRGGLFIVAGGPRKPAAYPSSGQTGLIDFRSFRTERMRRPS
jgi:hypothetical protein